MQVDYYSRYIDVTYLPSWTSAMVTRKLKNFFPHHGIPETIVSDNGTQSRRPSSHQNGWREGLEGLHAIQMTSITSSREQSSLQTTQEMGALPNCVF